MSPVIFRPEVTLTIADELKRARAIAEIGSYSFSFFQQISPQGQTPKFNPHVINSPLLDGESFVQADFRTDHMARLQAVKKEEGETDSI